MEKTILLLNGPNLNLLGSREPDVYGRKNLKDIENELKGIFSQKGISLKAFQSNHEGKLIDFLHENRDSDYLIINPGGLTHTSVSLRDALAGTEMPFIEIHISNVHSRESFRHHSYLSSIAQGVIVGCGTYGYNLAADLICQRITKSNG